MAIGSSIFTWKFHAQRSLVLGYSPWGHEELDMTKQLSALTCTHTHRHTHTCACATGLCTILILEKLFGLIKASGFLSPFSTLKLRRKSIWYKRVGEKGFRERNLEEREKSGSKSVTTNQKRDEIFSKENQTTHSTCPSIQVDSEQTHVRLNLAAYFRMSANFSS